MKNFHLVIPVWLLIVVFSIAGFAAEIDGYDADHALAISQGAIGRQLPNLEVTDTNGQRVALGSFLGRPVLVSMIFTSCYHVCPAITRHLATAAESAREALAEDSFQVLTVGFDTANDTPEAMRVFAREQSITDPNWAFLSADPETMQQLVDTLGFVYFPSPRGFDHINQVTLIDREGEIYRQVYGAAFDLPWLVEPLKELVYNRPQTNAHPVSSLLDRVRLFCTVYDPSTGRYRFDYSLFVQIVVGGLVLLIVGGWLTLEVVRARRRRRNR
ncbi:MAG TPA: SCO family protein [Xanthomonadales bacterium]|nr:SCO family protein [Xanthomonadales bacterium]